MTLRNDGSVRSANDPIWDNRYQIRDYGMYRGVVREVIYTDDERNDSGGSSEAQVPNEVLYTLMVIGGDRDGQLFNNARLVRSLGGFSNFDEIILKQLEGTTKSDPASTVALGDFTISNIPTFNGDVVYFHFLNGDLHMPVIIGMGYHQAAGTEATKDDGQRSRKKFNGILTEITKDGEFTWSKDNGKSVPVLPNPDNPLYPFVNQFAPLPGQDGAVTFTLGNEFNLSFDYNTGLNATIDGKADAFSFTTAAGASYNLNGVSDSHELGTKVGTTFKIDGIADSLDLLAAKGTELKIDGTADSIKLASNFGDSLSVSAKDGVQLFTPAGGGNTISMKSGEIAMTSGGQAFLNLGKATGFIKFGNANGDVLKDILQVLIQTLSTEAPAGFGAPLLGAATYVQLLAKLMLMTGG